MRILLTNDDGIEAEGIVRLARMAARFGEVWVVAPEHQCSAMSQRITLREELVVRQNEITLSVRGIPKTKKEIPKGTDLAAVLDGYISVGKVKCSVLL